MKKIALAFSLSLLIFACKTATKEKQAPTESKLAESPSFNADSAFYFVEKQVKFGPRVPNSTAHISTSKWIVSKLKEYGLTVHEQDFKPATYDGKILNAKNIIASYKPEASKRILLAAHWDTRPFADQDDDNENQPIAGANDGGSGTAILLELARSITSSTLPINVGVDFMFFDAEDWGAPTGIDTNGLEAGGYCLGSYYWARNPHKEKYTAFYGILFDMAGGKNATFRKEAGSMSFAPSIVNKVWNNAAKIGYSNYFLNENGPGLIDDHVPVNQIAGIPMIDIIHLEPINAQRTFVNTWHTHDDNLENVSSETLKAVGQTVLVTLYNE